MLDSGCQCQALIFHSTSLLPPYFTWLTGKEVYSQANSPSAVFSCLMETLKYGLPYFQLNSVIKNENLSPASQTEPICISFRLDHVIMSGQITVGRWDALTDLNPTRPVICLSARGRIQILKHSAEVRCKMIIHK